MPVVFIVFIAAMNVSNATSFPPSPGCSTSLPDTDSAVGLCIAFTVVLLFAVIGNSFVIWFARRTTKTKYNAFNYFLVSMAMADILDVISATPLHWIFIFFGNKWVGSVMGTVSCKIIYFLVDLSVYASVLTLVAITTDRYYAICHVMNTPLSRKRVVLILSGIWGTAALFACVQLYKFNVEYIQGDYYCYSSWNKDPQREVVFTKYEMVLKVALSYGIPLLIMVLMYGFIIRELWRRLDIFAQDGNHSLQRRIQRQNRPLVKMFITLVTLFAICWFPVHVNHMLIAFNYQQYLCLPLVLPLAFYLLAHANAAINPFMYIIFIENFRNALARNARSWVRWTSTPEGGLDVNQRSPKLTRLVTMFYTGSPKTRSVPNDGALGYDNDGAAGGEVDNVVDKRDRNRNDDTEQTNTNRTTTDCFGYEGLKSYVNGAFQDEAVTVHQRNTLPYRFQRKPVRRYRSNDSTKESTGADCTSIAKSFGSVAYRGSNCDFPRHRKRSSSMPTTFT